MEVAIGGADQKKGRGNYLFPGVCRLSFQEKCVGSSWSGGPSRERQRIPLTLSCSSDYVHQQMEGRVKQSRGSWQDNKGSRSRECLDFHESGKPWSCSLHGWHFGVPTLCWSLGKVFPLLYFIYSCIHPPYCQQTNEIDTLFLSPISSWENWSLLRLRNSWKVRQLSKGKAKIKIHICLSSKPRL